MAKKSRGPKTLAVDIGGSGIKVLVLDEKGRPVTERVRAETPKGATPQDVLTIIAELAKSHGRFDRASVGFPGVVVNGVIHTAANLNRKAWPGFDLESGLRKRLSVPVRVCNDADMQGLAVIEGKGVELVLTLGTGLGSGLYLDGRLVPNLELGHHPFRHGKTYEECLGQAALEKVGKKRWRRRVNRAVEQLSPIFNYRLLYLGGGNSKLLDPEDLPSNLRLVSNLAGLLGGIALWANSGR